MVPEVNIKSAMLLALSDCSRSCWRDNGTVLAVPEKPASPYRRSIRLRPKSHHAAPPHDPAPQGADRPAGRIVLPQKIANTKQHLGVAALKNIGRLGTLHASVQWHHHAAYGMRATGGDDPFMQIWGPDRHPVTGLHAQRNESGCRPSGCVQAIGVINRYRAVDDCLSMGKAIRGTPDHAGNVSGKSDHWMHEYLFIVL